MWLGNLALGVRRDDVAVQESFRAHFTRPSIAALRIRSRTKLI